MSKIVYMYIYTGNQELPNDENILTSDNRQLVGLDAQRYKGNQKCEVEKKHLLRPYEVEQSSFVHFIDFINQYNCMMRNIEFMHPLTDVEREDLNAYIYAKNNSGILEFIDEQRYEYSNDIRKISFTYLGNKSKAFNIEVMENGVISFGSNNINEVKKVFNSKLIKIFFGIRTCEVAR